MEFHGGRGEKMKKQHFEKYYETRNEVGRVIVFLHNNNQY